jgi:hypothetical protein
MRANPFESFTMSGAARARPRGRVVYKEASGSESDGSTGAGAVAARDLGGNVANDGRKRAAAGAKAPAAQRRR